MSVPRNRTRWVGCDALLEVREKALQSKSFSTEETAGVYGVGEIGRTSRSGSTILETGSAGNISGGAC